MNSFDVPRPVGPAQGVASDDSFLPGARASDSEALGRLFAPHLRHLYRSAFRVAGKPEDADDALQDGLLLALRNLKQFENRSQFSTWLTRIVVNAALMQRRKNKRRQVHLIQPSKSDGADLPIVGEIADQGPSPEEIYRQREQSQILQQHLQCLAPSCRAVLWLHSEGLLLREVAVELGMPEGTAKSHLHRARAILRKRLSAGDRLLPPICRPIMSDRSNSFASGSKT